MGGGARALSAGDRAEVSNSRIGIIDDSYGSEMLPEITDRIATYRRTRMGEGAKGTGAQRPDWAVEEAKAKKDPKRAQSSRVARGMPQLQHLKRVEPLNRGLLVMWAGNENPHAGRRRWHL